MSVAMQGKVARSGKRLAKMLRLQLKDDTVICLTDHDQDLAYNLGSGSEDYLAGYGMLASDIAFSTGLEPDSVEVTGPISELITLPSLMGGRFNGAIARLFEVCWDDLAAGYIPWLGGEVADARPQGSRFTLEICNVFARLQQSVGRTITNSCIADHTLPIDPRCGRTPETDVATVDTATDGMEVVVTVAAGPWEDGYFDKGTLVGLTGANVGNRIEVERWFESGLIKFFGFLPVIPEAGDTFTLVRGCGKTRPDCMARNNMVNFRGFPEVPGTAKILQPAIPGQGDDD